MSRSRIAVLCLGLLVLAGTGVSAQMAAETPRPLVSAYDSLADTILGAKQTEWNLVHAILAMTYEHAEAVAKQAQGKLDAGQDATEEIEQLAALVSQIGNEGDASVAAIRKRLVEAGHHHHSSGEMTGKYDEGFVIVTRDAKKAFLDAAKRIARLGGKADTASLSAEWKQVAAEFGKLHEGAR